MWLRLPPDAARLDARSLLDLHTAAERRWCQRRIGHVLSQCFQPSSLRKPLPPGPRRRAILRPLPRRMSRHSERWEDFSSRFSLVRLPKHGCMALVFEQEARKPSRSNCPQAAETKSHNDDFTTAASKMQSSMLPQSTLESPRLAAGMMPCSQEARSTCGNHGKISAISPQYSSDM